MSAKTRQRLLFGTGLLAVLAGAFVADHINDPQRGSAFYVLAMLASVVGMREAIALMHREDDVAVRWIVGLFGIAHLTAVFAFGDESIHPDHPIGERLLMAFATPGSCCIGLAMVLFARFLFGGDRTKVSVNVGSGLLVFVYVPVLAGFLIRIRTGAEPVDAREWWVVWTILTARMGDVGAFAFGKKLGKHKLIPAVSPGKTIEGCIGGLVTSAGVSVVIAMAAGLSGATGDLSIPVWIGLGALVGAVAQAGDLFESLLKREAGVKDSGAVVPQFGGVLDMIDGLLVAAPVVWFLAPWRW